MDSGSTACEGILFKKEKPDFRTGGALGGKESGVPHHGRSR